MTGPEGALDRPDEQAVDEALWDVIEPVLDGLITALLRRDDSDPNALRRLATIDVARAVRSALAAGPDGLRPSSRSTAAAHRLIAWLDEHPGPVAMDIRMVLADRSRGWNAYRRAALAGPRPAAGPDILAGYTGEDSDPELTADMAQAVAAEWDAVDARDAARPGAEPDQPEEGADMPLMSDLAKSTWNYRVVRQTVNGETLYGVHEAYDGGTSWTEDPVAPVAESVEELRDVLAKMAVAPEFEVIDGDAS